MNEYLHFDRITIDDFSEKNITSLYNQGYIFTRREKGVMDQTRSVRINLEHFEESSENRRILRNTHTIQYKHESIPYDAYNWKIGKLAKDFYDTKFGKGTFSANKIKEILTDSTETNFTSLLRFDVMNDPGLCIANGAQQPVGFVTTEFKPECSDGYAICYENKDMMHYAYPFYNLETAINNMGMGMMLLAILHAKNANKSYIYLGSAQRASDIYKLQFKGLEWFDGKVWQSDTEALKKLLADI